MGNIRIDLVYTQTLLYIVHVDDIETENHDKQQPSKLVRRVSKRTTASFNEQQGNLPVSTPPSFSFSNPFRRLNSKFILFSIRIRFVRV